MFAAKMIKFIGRPITNICVGEPIGVAKLLLTAIISASFYPKTPKHK